MADDEEETRQVELQALFTARTTAKRRHTSLARRINTVIQNGASRAELDDLLASLNQAHASLVDVHERFVTVSRLDGENLHTAQAYLESVQMLRTACLSHVERAQKAGAGGGWNVSVNVNATGHSARDNTPNNDNDIPDKDDKQQNAPVEPNRNVAFAIENYSQVNNDATVRRNLETNFEAAPRIDQIALAKRRKLDLEFLLQQKKVQIEREHMDLETKNQREQEDILFQIRKEEQLLAFLQLVAAANNNLCSTPIETRKNNFFAVVSSVNAPFPVLTPPEPNVTEKYIPLSSRTQPMFAPSSTYAPSHRWPKLVVAKFDGNPRGWTKYARNINATLGETSMPDSLKLLALQECLMEVIQRRMANIFTGSRTFQAAWAEIESKYGNPGLIIQAHNQHLQQLAPFKTGDFSGLFDMATAVRDAVSSVNPENCIMFTSVIGSLPAKMPMHLQTDWGKLAYSLKRMPTIIDFDRWIDTVVGAEELRGAKLSLNNNQANKNPAANYTRNNMQSAGSSNYNNRGPTILAGSLLPNTAT